MLDALVLRANLAAKILPNQLLVCRFGQSQVDSLVAIAQTLDKLIVFNLAEAISNSNSDSLQQVSNQELSCFVKVNDVVRAISGRRRATLDVSLPGDGGDLLLIGCASSVCVFDTKNELTLFQVSTSTQIHLFAKLDDEDESWPTICAGSQKLATLSFGFGSQILSGEQTSERSTSDTITCLIGGKLVIANGVRLIVSGSREHKIRLYQLDKAEHSISPSLLTLDEDAAIVCLCPIETVSGSYGDKVAAAGDDSCHAAEQMDYFAFGCENGLVGVYRLLVGGGSDDVRLKLGAERVWTYRARSEPACMQLLDVDGDGLVELVIGFRSGRVEARAPFAGSLLVATRCLKRNERLAAMGSPTVGSGGERVLLVCATSGALVGLKAAPASVRRRPLRGFGSAPNRALNSTRVADVDDEAHLASRLAYLTAKGDGRARDEQSEPNSAQPQVDTPTATSDLYIEQQNDNAKPTSCESRQGCELLQQLARALGDQLGLKRKLRRLNNETFQNKLAAVGFARAAAVGELPQPDVEIQWDCCWPSATNTGQSASLRLTVVVAQCERVELIELEDETRNFLPDGHLIVGRLAGNVGNSIILPPLVARKNESTQLKLRLICALASRPDALQQAVVFERLVHTPQFCMLAPISSGATSESELPKPAMSFRFDDARAAQLPLDWLAGSFLCFQLGNLIKLHERRLSCTSAAADGSRLAESLSESLRSSGRFELHLADLRRRPLCKSAAPSERAAAATLRVSCAHGGAEILIEADELELLVELVGSLVGLIDRLNLSAAGKFAVAPQLSGQNSISKELDKLQESSAELQATEHRLETELAESLDYAQNLMQQFDIASQLNEFSIAKQLLAEVGLMLGNAQGAAQTFRLNNQTRLGQVKRANQLKENISHLLALRAN